MRTLLRPNQPSGWAVVVGGDATCGCIWASDAFHGHECDQRSARATLSTIAAAGQRALHIRTCASASCATLCSFAAAVASKNTALARANCDEESKMLGLRAAGPPADVGCEVVPSLLCCARTAAIRRAGRCIMPMWHDAGCSDGGRRNIWPDALSRLLNAAAYGCLGRWRANEDFV